jgi:hypothetical protein
MLMPCPFDSIYYLIRRNFEARVLGSNADNVVFVFQTSIPVGLFEEEASDFVRMNERSRVLLQWRKRMTGIMHCCNNGAVKSELTVEDVQLLFN